MHRQLKYENIDPLRSSFRDLIRLNLGKNEISVIPREALVPLQYLQNLDLSDNKIGSLESGIFEGEKF